MEIQLTWCWWPHGFIVRCFGASEAVLVISRRAGKGGSGENPQWIPVDQQSCAAVELTWGRRAGVIDWRGVKIKVMTGDCHGNFWPDLQLVWRAQEEIHSSKSTFRIYRCHAVELQYCRIDQLQPLPVKFGRRFMQQKGEVETDEKKAHSWSDSQFSCD